MSKAVSLGYRSHQASTCGLHVHVNRDCLGDNREEQDETIIDTAVNSTEDELHKLSWSEFVATLSEPELISYLKEKRMYINDITELEEDL